MMSTVLMPLLLLLSVWAACLDSAPWLPFPAVLVSKQSVAQTVSSIRGGEAAVGRDGGTLDAGAQGGQLYEDKKAEFDPYADNGGTVVGIAGEDFCLVAADTRLCDKYMIRSRDTSRLFEVAEGLVLSGAGCWADIVQLAKVLTTTCDAYAWEEKQSIAAHSLAHLLAYVLYTRRSMPYYSFSCIAGLDFNAKHYQGQQGSTNTSCGALYRYDAIGSFERVRAMCAGKGEQMIQPLLDSLTNMDEDSSLWELSPGGDEFVSVAAATTGSSSSPYCVPGLSADAACDLVVRAFRSAAQREITIGDGLEVWIVRRCADGGARRAEVERRCFPLPSQ